jgi:DNA polymerase III epsilon subunit family exonuclease
MSLFRLPWRRRQAEHDARSLESLVTEGFVAIDLETTGLDPKHDAIIELAAIHFAGGRPGRVYVSHIDPRRPIRPESSRVHGITDEMVAGAPTIREALVKLERVCADYVLVGHGISFDLAVLGRERRNHGLTPITNPALDTRLLAAALHPDWDRFSFDEVAARVGIGILGRHTAEGDARAAGELLLALLPETRERGIRTVSDLVWLQATVVQGNWS